MPKFAELLTSVRVLEIPTNSVRDLQPFVAQVQSACKDLGLDADYPVFRPFSQPSSRERRAEKLARRYPLGITKGVQR